jgi:hypothetical protein
VQNFRHAPAYFRFLVPLPVEFTHRGVAWSIAWSNREWACGTYHINAVRQRGGPTEEMTNHRLYTEGFEMSFVGTVPRVLVEYLVTQGMAERLTALRR